MQNAKCWLIMGLVLACGKWNCFADTCPSKISAKLCSLYLIANDTTFLKVRIVLDASQEMLFPKGVKRPLRVWTEDLMEKYDLRDLDNADSAYRTGYGDADLSPSIQSVMYHNVNVEKSNLERLISEEYIKTVEEGCRTSLTYLLCSEVNSRNDSEYVLYLAFYQDGLYRDSVAFETFLLKYRFYDFKNISRALPASEIIGKPYVGYYSTIQTVKDLSLTEEVRFLEPWSEPSVTTVRTKSWKSKSPDTKYQSNQAYRYHLLDGKEIPSSDPKHGMGIKGHSK